MDNQIPLETELIERLDWLIRLRWLAVLGFGAVLVLAYVLYPGGLRLGPLGGVTILIALYNIPLLFYARALKQDRAGADRLRNASRFACVQIILDLLALAALIHFSGGVENPLAMFLVFPILIAGILLSQRASFSMAALAALLFVAVGVLEYTGLLSHYHLPVLGETELYLNIAYVLTVTGIMVSGLWLAAYLTSSISVKLREREREPVQSLGAILPKYRELEAANERLRRVDAERTRFVTLATHELRAPLNTIHTCVELALASQTSPQTVRDILERVKKRTSELTELVSDLLRLAPAREEMSRDEVLGLVHVEDVLQSVLQLVRTEADEKDLLLSVEIDPGLALVRANADQLKLVWTNLLSNAIRYTEAGGIVAVELKQTPEHLVGAVRDTGIGIAPEDLRRIFEEFFRAENAQTACPVGTGVGLPIVQRIIQNLGGRLAVESELGLGSKFSFVLPRAGV
jgi:signal transduction histidine kinase